MPTYSLDSMFLLTPPPSGRTQNQASADLERESVDPVDDTFSRALLLGASHTELTIKHRSLQCSSGHLALCAGLPGASNRLCAALMPPQPGQDGFPQFILYILPSLPGIDNHPTVRLGSDHLQVAAAYSLVEFYRISVQTVPL